jgi:hypothetical protein
MRRPRGCTCAVVTAVNRRKRTITISGNPWRKCEAKKHIATKPSPEVGAWRG